MRAGKMEREDGAGKGRGIGVIIDEMKDVSFHIRRSWRILSKVAVSSGNPISTAERLGFEVRV